MTLLTIFFLFSLLKIVLLKLQDYPSLSHIVIQIPPAAGNKVKKNNQPNKKCKTILFSVFIAFGYSDDM